MSEQASNEQASNAQARKSHCRRSSEHQHQHQGWWLKSHAEYVQPVFTKLNDKQVLAITEYFTKSPAGRCFFSSDDFDEYGAPCCGGTIGAHAAAEEHPDDTKGKTLVAKAVGQALEGLHTGMHELEHRQWSINQELHHFKEESFMTAIGAGLVNYILMFAFCCCYGMMIFFQPGHADHRILGIKMNITSAVVMGLMLSRISKVPIAIGGPDMNAVIFIGDFVKRISEVLVKELHLDESTISGPEYSGFCMGDHYSEYTTACDSYNEQLRATVIFSVTMSTAILSIFFLIVGGCRLTIYISYMPTSIVDAFLSCMGYKVFKFAVKLCNNDPTIFIPAAGVGVPLYFLKAMHIGNPMFVMPTMMSVPFLIHYLLMAMHGWNQDDARERGYFFDVFHDEDPFSVYKDGVYAKGAKINYAAWWNTKIELLTMIVVCMLDCLVTAIRTTESKLPVKVHKDWEMMVGGFGDIIGAMFCSVSGYLQLKFNVMNYGILQNVKDRRAGGILALAMGITFFLNIEFLNYVPKAFICMLLFFSASGFVAEHLWGSKEYLSRHEWVQVCIILLIFIATDEIIYAVTVGVTLCGITFIAQYSYIPCIAGRPLRGGEIYSREYYRPMVSKSLRHIADNWLLVIRLKGFIFFASVQLVIHHLRSVFREENERNVPAHERIKFIVLDCALLDGMDSSAEKDIQMLVCDAEQRGVRFLWTSVPKTCLELMLSRRTIRNIQDVFDSCEVAILYIEGLVLEYRKKQQLFWEELHPAFALNRQLICLRESFEPFMSILRLDVERFGCPWEFCESLKIRRCRTCLWGPNEQNRELFLVHTGAVGIFHDLPSPDGAWEVSQAQAIYRHGWLINREAVMKMPTNSHGIAVEDGQVIYWSRHQWWRMSREQPAMAQAIMEAAMRQANMDIDRMNKDMQQLVKASLNDDIVAQSVLHSRHRDDQDAEEETRIDLPSDLMSRLEDMEAAQSLESFRLYEPLPDDEPGALPALPMVIRRDLEIAFNTYSVKKGRQPLIPWEKVNEALMYAGIFNSLLEKTHPELTEGEFIQVGHEAALMRLSVVQVAKIYNVFKEFAHEDGTLSRDDLIVVFKASFLPDITEQEVNGIANTWDDDGSGAIEVGEFVSIVSRFVRRHEQDWNLLRGFREVLHKSERSQIHGLDILNQDKLVNFSKANWTTEVTRAEAEELLWSNACFGRIMTFQDYGKLLDWSGIAAAVLLHIDQPFGKLPPDPVTPKNQHRRGGIRRGTHVIKELMLTGSGAQEESSSPSSNGSGEDEDPPLSSTGTRLSRSSGTQAIGKQQASASFTHAGDSSGGESAEQPLLPASQRDEGKAGKDGQQMTRRKKANQKSSQSEIRPAGMTLQASQEARSSADASNPDLIPRKSVTFPEYDLLGSQPEVPRVSNMSEESMHECRPSQPPRKAVVLASAKAKFKRASNKIIRAAAEELVKECNIESSYSPLKQCVIDLRDYPTATAVPTKFSKTRLSAEDFAADNRRSMQRREHHGYHLTGGVPNTPDAKIFLLLEDPASSRAANIWSIVMAVLIIMSVALLFLKPLAYPDESRMSHEQKMYWKVIECCFTIIFLSELVVRFAVCAALKNQTHLEFIMQPLNLCDLVSVLPFFLEMVVNSNEDEMRLLRIARLMRLARVMRLARLSRKSKIFGPVSFVFSIIWGIYLRETTH